MDGWMDGRKNGSKGFEFGETTLSLSLRDSQVEVSGFVSEIGRFHLGYIPVSLLDSAAPRPSSRVTATATRERLRLFPFHFRRLGKEPYGTRMTSVLRTLSALLSSKIAQDVAPEETAKVCD